MNSRFRSNPKALAAALASALCAGAANADTGPSTSTAPYLVPVAAGVEVTSILTVGDSVNTKPDGVTPYRMVGIPDGLGAYDNGDGTLTVLMNHELNARTGIARAHGAVGAFVSRWIIDGTTLAVLNGQDLITSPSRVNLWNGADDGFDSVSTAFNRLCSADLAAPSAFYDTATGNGFDGLIYMNGEESGDEGRGFGWVLSGTQARTAWQLPALGRISWENSVASPFPQAKTIVMTMDDDGLTDSQLYMYVGTKLSAAENPSARPFELAGLHNGVLYGARVKGTSFLNEDRNVGFAGPSGGAGNGKIEWMPLGDVTNTTGTATENAGDALLVSGFRRIEDGHWDPNHPERFYFVTTDTTLPSGRSRLWRVTFTDIRDPKRGAALELLLDGTEGHEMLDNMTVAGNGKLYLQEDQGSSSNLAKVWEYDPATDALKALARFDPALFDPAVAGAALITTNEESSGIIDVTDLIECETGHTCLLLDAQVHRNIAASQPELAEMGQLMLLQVLD